MMNKNEKFVITINRELGSGGRTVGQKLAEKLGVSYYDKAVIKALQEKYHCRRSITLPWRRLRNGRVKAITGGLKPSGC